MKSSTRRRSLEVARRQSQAVAGWDAQVFGIGDGLAARHDEEGLLLEDAHHVLQVGALDDLEGLAELQHAGIVVRDGAHPGDFGLGQPELPDCKTRERHGQRHDDRKATIDAKFDAEVHGINQVYARAETSSGSGSAGTR